MPIVLRTQKGSELTYQELDGNFTTLETRSALSYIKDTQNNLLYANGEYDFGSNILKYANAIQSESDLANYSPATYHGMTMHVHSTGALYYAHAGAWRKLLTDTSYNNVEGVGYVDPLSDVAYDGDYNSLSNTPAIPNKLTDLGITDGSNGQVLSTDGSGNFTFVSNTGGASALDDLSDVSVSGATSGQILKYDGTNWTPATDLTADSGSGITLEDLSVSVQAAGTANLDYDNTTGVFNYTPPDLSSYALSADVPNKLLDLNINDGTNGQVLSTDGAGNFSFIDVSGSGDLDQDLFATIASDSGTTTANTAADTLTITGGTDISTSISGDTLTISYTGSSSGIAAVVDDSTPQLGGDLDVNGNSVLHTFDVVNNGLSDYTFSDAGNHWFPTSENDPVLYLRRGETYVFDVNASGHPFEIRVSNGGSAYNTGVTNNGAQIGQVEFKVPMSAPSTLYYQCTVHSGMGNTINVV